MIDLDRLAPRAAPGIRILPLVHERVEMAGVVRLVLAALDPAAVAVEIPTTLAAAVSRAVRRLPRISVIVSQEAGAEALVWVVAPGDPFVEALRWAAERGRPGFCIDPDLPYDEAVADPLPDPYALWSLGAEDYLELAARAGAAGAVSEAERARESGMAYHVRRWREQLSDGTLLVLVGAAHAKRLADRLVAPLAHPFARARRASVDLLHLHPRALTGLLPDAPLAHAVWELIRAGDLPPRPALEQTLSRRVSLIRFGLRVITGEGGEGELRRRRRLVDYACHHGARRWRDGVRLPDRRALAGVVWRIAAASYRDQTGETIEPWQRRLFFDFGGRYARLQGALAPGLFEWVVAARGAADDNLAWEAFDAARTFPWQEESAEIATAHLDGSSLDLGTRKVRFRRRFFRVKRRPLALPVRERPVPDDPAEWLAAFAADGVCSYPPEDLVIEDYGRFLQRKAISVLSSERQRSEPFTTGLLDGIDLRETLGNLQDDRIYVREMCRVPGEAGSVVVILDRDPEDLCYPFRMTWLGEHDQESDMAFYSTPPAEQVVGPGIMRATYGGFLLTRPRGRLFDVWQDPDYRLARSKAEVLLMAAVDYSQEKIVVHVAREAPSLRMSSYAAAMGKRIVHLPIASLSPSTLRRIRVVHLLAGRDKRATARDFIW